LFEAFRISLRQTPLIVNEPFQSKDLLFTSKNHRVFWSIWIKMTHLTCGSPVWLAGGSLPTRVRTRGVAWTPAPKEWGWGKSLDEKKKMTHLTR
jgi:hypothetical protein